LSNSGEGRATSGVPSGRTAGFYSNCQPRERTANRDSRLGQCSGMHPERSYALAQRGHITWVRDPSLPRSAAALLTLIMSIAVLVVARHRIHGPLYIVIFSVVTLAFLFVVRRLLSARAE
jgi:hypothetical protein